MRPSGWARNPCRKWYNFRMTKTLSDLSRLTKAILKETPPPCPVEKPAQEPSQSREDADAAAGLAEIAYLDKLRTCEGEEMPVGLPLACVVKVIAYEEVPKASEQYAMATVEGRDGRTWRLCIRRYYLEEGMRALFVSHDALLPSEDERFDNLDVCKLHERVFRFGFGVKERRKFPFVKRNVYHNNCGVLYPLDDFHELLEANVGDDCAAKLHIESEAEMQRLASASSTPKKKAVFQPKLTKPVKDDFLAKLRLHRKRYGW